MTHQSNPNANTNNITGQGIKLNTLSASNVNFTGAQTTNGTITATLAGNVTGFTTYANNVTVQSPRTQSPPPAGWRTYKTSSVHDDDVHESPVHGRAAYLASLNTSNRYGRFHWNVFYSQNPEVKHLFTGVAETKGATIVTISGVMFFDPIEHARFEEWLVEYQAKFGSRENLYSNYFPAPPSRLSSMMPTIWVHGPADLVDVAAWMSRHCLDQVFAVGEMFFFQNEEDAIAYKLKFS